MRLVRAGFEFGVELNAHIEIVFGNFHRFHNVVIGQMCIRDRDKDISVVPGGSYDGSAAVEIRGGDSAERYFQQLDGVKFVLGDTAVKATGYFKVTAGNTEPKICLLYTSRCV